VIQVGDKGALKTMTPSSLIEKEGQVGVEFTGAGETVTAMFNSEGPDGGEIKIGDGQFKKFQNQSVEK
jgi:hypothetical protein